MNTYQDLILRELKTEFPQLEVSAETEFEAVSKIIFGSKQRRLGPMPTPETQITIREVIRKAFDSRPDERRLTFFVPWACSKQDESQKLDILELYALKQIRTLQTELINQGIDSAIVFRLEDVGDQLLLDPNWYPFNEKASDKWVNFKVVERIQDYRSKMIALASRILHNVDIRYESAVVSAQTLAEQARSLYPLFHKMLSTEFKPTIPGWTGGIPDSQKEHYLRLYATLYPTQPPLQMLAWYFSITKARKDVGAYLTPTELYNVITFEHPVPGSPKRVLHYRTLPERYTNRHSPPWMSKGVLQINEQGCVTPKYIEAAGKLEVVSNTINFAGVDISANYYLV